MDNRVNILRIIIVAILIILALRAGQLQLLMGNYYYQLSDANNYLSFYNMYKFQEDVYMKSCNSET